MGEGGQAGDVTAEGGPQRRRLRLTQFGELSGRVDDGAMVLTQLRAVSRQRFDGRGESLIGESIGELLDRHGSPVRYQSDEPASPLGGEGCHGVSSVTLGEEPQRLQSQGVVRLIARGSSRAGQGEDRTGPTPARIGVGAEGSPIERLDEAGILQGSKGAANRRRRDPEVRRERRGRRRPVLGETASYSLGGFGREFHNTIVT